MRSLSLILTDPGPEADLIAGIDRALLDWSQTEGIGLDHQDKAIAGPPIRIDRWVERDGPLVFELVRDDGLRRPYLSIVHPDVERRRAVWEAMRRRAPCVTTAQLKQDARSGAADPSAYPRLALGSPPEPDAETVALIATGLGSDDLEARAQAAMAAGLLLWPAFEAPLESALGNEPDRGVADMMTAALRFLRARATPS